VGGEVTMPSCPHCGASARPLWHRVVDNRNAAVLALFALAALTVGILMPFVSMVQFGAARTFSLVGGIRELFDRGNVFIGIVLLVFSVVFPYAKLLAILVATSRLVHLGMKTRRRLAHVAHVTGRYSMLDILVVAVMIVVVKFDGLVEIKAMPGTVLFCVAVFLSIAAGMCVNLEGKQASDDR
jgi:paraquat-inducible protein A